MIPDLPESSFEQGIVCIPIASGNFALRVVTILKPEDPIIDDQ